MFIGHSLEDYVSSKAAMLHEVALVLNFFQSPLFRFNTGTFFRVETFFWFSLNSQSHNY